jgi:hypothetical protein
MATDFLNVLTEARNGAIAVDLNEKFNRLLTAVLETAGTGKLTVEFKVEPAKQGFGGAVIEVNITHDVKMKVPELKVGSAMFYVLPDGSLSREDPAQTAMFEAEQKQSDKEKKTRGVQ